MIRHVIGCATILADAHECLVVLKPEPGRQTIHAVRTTGTLERARSALWHAVPGELRPTAVDRLLSAWESHLRAALKAAEERHEERGVIDAW